MAEQRTEEYNFFMLDDNIYVAYLVSLTTNSKGHIKGYISLVLKHSSIVK